MTIAEALLELEAVGGNVRVWRPSAGRLARLYVNSTWRLNERGRPAEVWSMAGDREDTVDDRRVWVGVSKVIEDKRSRPATPHVTEPALVRS